MIGWRLCALVSSRSHALGSVTTQGMHPVGRAFMSFCSVQLNFCCCAVVVVLLLIMMVLLFVLSLPGSRAGSSN